MYLCTQHIACARRADSNRLWHHATLELPRIEWHRLCVKFISKYVEVFIVRVQACKNRGTYTCILREML